MQNRYVGDVGDFAKYALLRALLRQTKSHLGIVWCLFPDEAHNADGRHTGYLQNPHFYKLDPTLHECLGRIVHQNRRSVRSIARARIFPPGTIFYETLISPLGTIETTRTARQEQRDRWLRGALIATEKCDLVFFDPDNGLEVTSVPKLGPKGGKYIFWNELQPFWERGQTVVVYHHLNRTASVTTQTEALKAKFSVAFPNAKLSKGVLFRRGSCRHFWIVGQAKHASSLNMQIDRMLKEGWSDYLSVF